MVVHGAADNESRTLIQEAPLLPLRRVTKIIPIISILYIQPIYFVGHLSQTLLFQVVDQSQAT